MRDSLKPHTQQIIEAEIARLERDADPVRPKQRVAISDQKALLNVDPRHILIGDIDVYEDREPRPR